MTLSKPETKAVFLDELIAVFGLWVFGCCSGEYANCVDHHLDDIMLVGPETGLK